MENVYQWVTVSIAVVGILGTWIFGSFRLGRAVEQIKSSMNEKITAETKQIDIKIDAKLSSLLEKFDEDQKSQDHNFGEVGLSLRQKIADVQQEMHQIEIWGRDNFVLKSEFAKATDSIRADIKAMAADIKADLRDLSVKVASH